MKSVHNHSCNNNVSLNIDIAGAHHHSGLPRTIPQATLPGTVFIGILQGAGVPQSPMAVITLMETLINPDISRCFCHS